MAARRRKFAACVLVTRRKRAPTNSRRADEATAEACPAHRGKYSSDFLPKILNIKNYPPGFKQVPRDSSIGQEYCCVGQFLLRFLLVGKNICSCLLQLLRIQRRWRRLPPACQMQSSPATQRDPCRKQNCLT